MQHNGSTVVDDTDVFVEVIHQNNIISANYCRWHLVTELELFCAGTYMITTSFQRCNIAVNNLKKFHLWRGTCIYVIVHPNQHKIRLFRRCFLKQISRLGTEKTKPNTTKARIHQSKEVFYNTK